MSSTKPTIGVTGPDNGGTAAWIFTAFAVWLQGGRPLRIRPLKPVDISRLDGLILGGGADINPERYGELLEQPPEEKPRPKGLRSWMLRLMSWLFFPILFLIRNIFSTKNPSGDGERDELEFKLLDQAYKRNIPILGICRGAQLINVQFGGTLHQDIAGFYTEVPKVHTIWPQKIVSIKQQTRLYKIIGSGAVWVNALHHQAVDALGNELKISARDKAEIVQAIEYSEHSYLVGVQWHPEYLPQIKLQRNIFKELVLAARSKKQEE